MLLSSDHYFKAGRGPRKWRAFFFLIFMALERRNNMILILNCTHWIKTSSFTEFKVLYFRDEILFHSQIKPVTLPPTTLFLSDEEYKIQSLSLIKEFFNYPGSCRLLYYLIPHSEMKFSRTLSVTIASRSFLQSAHSLIMILFSMR